MEFFHSLSFNTYFIYLVYSVLYLDLHKFSCFWHHHIYWEQYVLWSGLQCRNVFFFAFFFCCCWRYCFIFIQFDSIQTRCRLNDVFEMQRTDSSMREKMEKFTIKNFVFAQKFFAFFFFLNRKSNFSPQHALYTYLELFKFIACSLYAKVCVVFFFSFLSFGW